MEWVVSCCAVLLVALALRLPRPQACGPHLVRRCAVCGEWVPASEGVPHDDEWWCNRCEWPAGV